ncbi:DUF2537 domain-containing protein [Labedaea rhizosphaerae]|uniref:Uncharacterized protein DUF2537 n=1 Tax=Labedaea rhizosphaerae TaxID=598644 RepID=A0A4R6SKW4_LABRH|nr:DUF2537 domain-containing protein [Labedaea rhizosphaerae]TDQ04524.1 uncharacterized protein DUF2537 [Labedaea rhizosphaerae]
MELRASGERAVLTGHDGARELEVDPGSLPLGAELTAALQQWAQVVGAVLRIEGDADRETAASVVTGRGRQLAARVAAALNVPVGYRDPLTGELSVMDPPAVAGKPAPGAEPTPWATGLVVAAFSAVVVLVAVVSLAGTLEETSPLLALGANVVVTAGLLPSVWLARGVLTWRWVALGVAVGIGLSWFALAFMLL